MKLKKVNKVTITVAVVCLSLVGLGLWTFNLHQANQKRLEQQRTEAANMSLVSRIVKETYGSFFKLLQNGNVTHAPLGVREFINSTGGQNIDDTLRQQYLDNPKSPVSLVGCRSSFSDELITSGFTFGKPVKVDNVQYVVPVTYKGDSSSRGKPSLSSVVVDASTKKIIKFDCTEQNKIDAQAQKAAAAEQHAQ